MTFVKGMKRLPGAGRKKGDRFKPAQETIARVANSLGGHKALLRWARDSGRPSNQADFWTKIYTKLLALQVTGAGGGPLTIHLLPQDKNL